MYTSFPKNKFTESQIKTGKSGKEENIKSSKDYTGNA